MKTRIIKNGGEIFDGNKKVYGYLGESDLATYIAQRIFDKNYSIYIDSSVNMPTLEQTTEKRIKDNFALQNNQIDVSIDNGKITAKIKGWVNKAKVNLIILFDSNRNDY